MGRKILLIDDSAMLRRIATNILHGQPARYDVVTATRAAEGFALACIGGVDLILLDYLLAGLDDVQLCRRLQADARTARVPTVLLTGQGIRPPALAGLPPNVVDILGKPFAPEQLSGVVNTVMGLSKSNPNLRDLRASLHPNLAAAEPPPADQPPVVDQPVAINGTEPPAGLRHGRGGGSGAPPDLVPQDGEVLLQGTTANTSLCGALHAIARDGHTGILRVWASAEEPTEIVFEEGKLVVVSTRDADTYATRAADVLPTKVSPATLEEALAEQKSTGTPFLLNLGVRGLISKASAVALLDRFGQRQFSRLWPRRAQPPVHFEFRGLATLPQYVLRLGPPALPLDRWMLETTRHLRAEELAVNLRHEGSVGTPFFQTNGEAVVKRLELAEDERAFLKLVNGRTDLPTLARMLGTSQETVYLLLFRLRCLDVLSYRTAPAAFAMTPRSSLRRVLPLKR